MAPAADSSRVGVFVDVSNIARNGGFGMRYDVLREFACRGGAQPLRLNAYATLDSDRADQDSAYREGQYRFFASLRDLGYKVLEKPVRWYIDENGNRFGKANADLDMAVDALQVGERMDRAVLATGDGDFYRVVQALQDRGCQVEVVAFENVSSELRRVADRFTPGWLIPRLLPTQESRHADWGETGSRVRGVCYSHTGKGYGFLRFLNSISPDLWKTDSRLDDSPYESVFFHDSQLPEGVSSIELPSRGLIFEFELAPNEGRETGLQAIDLQVVSPWRRGTSLPGPNL